MAELIVKRGTVYHARLDVPKDVQPLIGKKVLGRSLKTSSLAEAKAAAAYVTAEWRRLILDARGRLNNDGWKLEAFEAVQKIRADASLGRDTKFEYGPKMRRAFDEYLREAFPDGVPEGLSNEISEERAAMLLSNSPPKVSFFNDVILERFKTYRLQEVETTTAERETSDMRSLGKYLSLKGYGFDAAAISAWLESTDVKRAVKKRKLQAGRTFIKYLKAHSYFPVSIDDPFAKVELPKERRKMVDDKRLPFETVEVQKLYSEAAKKDALLANAIAIAAYTGMRAEEIAQIRGDDVLSENDAYFIRVSRAATKTDAGVRVVPVHKAIEHLILNLKRATNSGYLLDYSSYSRIGKRSTLLVTRFSKLKRSLGFSSNKTFHSLRHALVTRLETASIPENVTADIVGHAKKTMTYGLYSSGTSLALRAEAINKIESYQLDL